MANVPAPQHSARRDKHKLLGLERSFIGRQREICKRNRIVRCDNHQHRSRRSSSGFPGSRSIFGSTAIAVAMRSLYRDEYPSERTTLNEVTKRLCGVFKRKCAGDDRYDVARFEKLCNRRPCF
jgi:hypothetical protein